MLEKGIILHIGAPKTGTTYLQEWLKLNAPALEKCAIKPLSSASSHRLGVEHLSDTRRFNRPDVLQIKQLSLQDAMDELVAALNQYSTVVISSEYFHESSPSKVVKLLSTLDAPVTQIVCYLRRQDVICAAGYAEEVRSLGRTDLVRHAQYTCALDWYMLYTEWKKLFSHASVDFRNFDKARGSGGLAQDFAALIRAKSLHAKSIDEVINPTLSSEMVELARLINEIGQPLTVSSLLAIQEVLNCTPFSFSQDVTSQFESAFIDSNRRLAAAIPGEFDDFAKSGWIAHGKDFTGALPPDRVAQIFAESFRFISRKSEQLAETSGQLAEKSGQLAETSEQLAEKSGQLAETSEQLAETSGQLAEKSYQIAVMELKHQSPRYLARELLRATLNRIRIILRL